MKKRVAAILTAFCLLFSLFPATAFAAGPYAMDYDLRIVGGKTADVKTGDEIQFELWITNNQGGLYSLDWQIKYDSAAFEIKADPGVKSYGPEGMTNVPANSTTPGEINGGAFIVVAAVDTVVDTKVCEVTFTAKKDIDTPVPFTVQQKADGTSFADESDYHTVIGTPTGNTKQTVSVSISPLAVDITAPVKGETPQSDITETAQYTGAITWEGNPTTFVADTAYTANVTLTAKTGYQFAEGVTPSVAGSTEVTGVEVKDSGKTLTFKAAFDKTGTATLTGIKIIDKIDGHALTVDVPHAAPNTTETNTLTLVATSVYDAAPGGPVAATWEITNDPKPTGVSIDENTGKLTVDNTAAGGNVNVKAKFDGKTDRVTVAITKETAKETHIVATAPATTNITVPNGGTKTSGNCSYTVYDQYGAEMTGSHATWIMEPATVNGVTHSSDNGSISVTNDATTCTVKLYATSGVLKSNPITYTITREESKPHLVTITGVDSMNVPIVHAPGADGWDHKTYTAEVKDQYNNVISDPSVEWSVTGPTGVSIDKTTGKLTVSNKANAGTVTITAKSGDASGTKTVTINKDVAKASLVEICNQVGEAPETRLLIPAATFTNNEAYTAKVYDQYGVYMPGEMVRWALDPATVAGVELDTVTSSGNAILKVDSTATSGTTFKLKATTATPGTTGVKELDITVQKKTNVSDKINFNDGTLIYNGEGQEYKTAALDSSVAAGDGGTWTYTYTAGTGTLDTATGLPKTVGTYTVTAKYEDSSNIGSKSATLTITPKTVDIPAPDTTVYTYDGTAKTYQIPTSPYYTVSGNIQTNASEAGHIVTVTLKDTTNTTWADGGVGQKIFMFKIMRATPTGEPAYTEITTSGKTLANANLTKGTITLDGTIKWNDAEATVVEANKSYGWTYTPADTTNYKPLTGTIKLWNKSTSGGYYYAPTTAVVPDMPMLYRGCTGDAVKTLQDKLNALGYNSGSVDGIFGAKTYAAVTAFQKANSLGVDGIVGKLTWGKLYGVSPAMPVETTTVVGRPTVSYGSRGDAVRKLQELLNALGYDCGSVDGIFGSKTKAAVLAFQKANGLGVDGIVGPLTWAKLG